MSRDTRDGDEEEATQSLRYLEEDSEELEVPELERQPDGNEDDGSPELNTVYRRAVFDKYPDEVMQPPRIVPMLHPNEPAGLAMTNGFPSTNAPREADCREAAK